MSGKIRNINSFGRFLDYLSKKLKGKERNSFEKELERDPFEKEAMEGLSILSAEEFSADMIDLNSRLHQRIYRKRAFPYYRLAAGVAAMIVVSVLFFTLTNRELKDISTQKEVAESKAETLEKDSNVYELSEKEPAQETIIEKQETPKQEVKQREKTPAVKKAIGTEVKKEEIQATKMDMISKETSQLMEPRPPTIASAVQEKEISEYQTTVDQPLETAGKSSRLEVPREAKREIEILPGMIPANSVRGKVLASDDNLPLPGAAVAVKGSDKATLTDTEGNFVIPLDNADSSITLTASYIGMETEEMQVATGSPANILMKPDELSLDEVVVTAYGKGIENNAGSYTEPSPLPDYISFKKYIENNIRFPESISGISRAVVVCRFLVGNDGRIKQFEIIRSPDEAFSEEAKRLLLEGPVWKPSEIDGDLIEESVRLRLVFKK